MRRNLLAIEGVLILTNGDSEAETRPTHHCLLVSLGGGGECSSCTRGRKGRTHNILR